MPKDLNESFYTVLGKIHSKLRTRFDEKIEKLFSEAVKLPKLKLRFFISVLEILLASEET